MKLETFRKEYSDIGIPIASLGDDPIELFQKWLAAACESPTPEPTAFVLSTTGSDGQPHSRILLLKRIKEGKFYFFTNYESQKAQQLQANPRVSLCFPWITIEKQVILQGSVERCSPEENAEYFALRPRGSQLGAWASKQSTPVVSRADLDNRYREVRQQFEGQDIPLPDYWGGYKITPQTFEFWSGRKNRMHDRFLFSKQDERWQVTRLSP